MLSCAIELRLARTTLLGFEGFQERLRKGLFGDGEGRSQRPVLLFQPRYSNLYLVNTLDHRSIADDAVDLRQEQISYGVCDTASDHDQLRIQQVHQSHDATAEERANFQ